MTAPHALAPDHVPARLWIAIYSAILGVFMAVLDTQITNASLASILGSLSAPRSSRPSSRSGSIFIPRARAMPFQSSPALPAIASRTFPSLTSPSTATSSPRHRGPWQRSATWCSVAGGRWSRQRDQDWAAQMQTPNRCGVGRLGMDPGDDLLSHGQSAISSARRRFTALFGMGRGGANALWSPGIRLWTCVVLGTFTNGEEGSGRVKALVVWHQTRMRKFPSLFACLAWL